MFERILAPLDGSSLAECVLPHLVSMATTYDARVSLVQVLECSEEAAGKPVDPLDWEMYKAEAEAYLDDVKARLEEAGVHKVRTVLLEGRPAQRLLEFVEEQKVDLILLSSHGKAGLSRWSVNSVVRKIVQRANRSAMIVRGYKAAEMEALAAARYERLLVPLDGSQRAECALSPAVTLTRAHGAELLVGHVVIRPEIPRQLPLTDEDRALIDRFVERSKELSAGYLDQLHGRLSLEFEAKLRVDEDVAAALHEMVDEESADLVVLCAHGYSGKTKWPFGSVTTSFIEYGTTPLLMVQDLDPEDIEPTEAEKAAEESKGH